MKQLSLSEDEISYITMVKEAINSDYKYTVEYINGEYTSPEGATAYASYMDSLLGEGQGVTALTPDGQFHAGLIQRTGNGLTVPTVGGSHSYIYVGGGLAEIERSIVSGHEVFGHGLPSAKLTDIPENNINAVRTENLIRRLLGLPQYDGSTHAGYESGQISDPFKLPMLQ